MTQPGSSRYRDLDTSRTAPHRAAWDAFGVGDEVGTVNRLTAESVRRAATLVRRGVVFPLDWRMDLPDPPILGRGRLHRTVVELDGPPNPGLDDRFDGYYTQASSQWDALCHVGHPEYGYYGGRTFADVGPNGQHDGIDQWARRGIVGRFVLADVARRRAALGTPLRADQRAAIRVGELEEVLAAQRVELGEGDVLLVRFGWITWYEGLDEHGRAQLVDPILFPAPGLAAEERTAEWLWDRGVAAVAADCPALEAMPFDKSSVDTFLHFRLVVLLGMAIGELFDLDRLAADCDATGVYEGLFTSAPMNIVGGAGSPANALAIK
jgi:kynurenine formamidase